MQEDQVDPFPGKQIARRAGAIGIVDQAGGHDVGPSGDAFGYLVRVALQALLETGKLGPVGGQADTEQPHPTARPRSGGAWRAGCRWRSRIVLHGSLSIVA